MHEVIHAVIITLWLNLEIVRLTCVWSEIWYPGSEICK